MESRGEKSDEGKKKDDDESSEHDDWKKDEAVVGQPRDKRTHLSPKSASFTSWSCSSSRTFSGCTVEDTDTDTFR